MKKLLIISSFPVSLLLCELGCAQGGNSLTLTSKKSTGFPVIQPVATPAPPASHTVHQHVHGHHHHHHGHHGHHGHKHSYRHAHHHHAHHHEHYRHSKKTESKVVSSSSPTATLPPPLLRAPSHPVTTSTPVRWAPIASDTKNTHLTLVSTTSRSTNLMMPVQVKQPVQQQAAMDSMEARARYFHPFVTISGGMVNTMLGKPINFPVNNSRYYYNPSNRYKTLSILGASIGDELQLARHVSLQVGVSYYGEASTRVSGQLAQGITTQSMGYYRYHYTVSSQQVFLENKLLFELGQYYHPYFSFGVGESFNKAYQFATTVSPYDTYTPSFNGTTIPAFAWTVGAGVDADLTNHVRFGVGYRFDYLGPVSLERGQLITQAQTINLPYRLKQPVWRLNTFLAQLTYIM